MGPTSPFSPFSPGGPGMPCGEHGLAWGVWKLHRQGRGCPGPGRLRGARSHHVPRPSCPGRPMPTPLRSLPAGQGGRLRQGDPAIPHLLSVQTSPAARGVPALRQLPAKGEVGLSAACPTETPMCGVEGQGGEPRGEVGFSRGNKQGGKGARQLLTAGPGCPMGPWIPVGPGGPYGTGAPA